MERIINGGAGGAGGRFLRLLKGSFVWKESSTAASGGAFFAL